jgi:diphthine synthase
LEAYTSILISSTVDELSTMYGKSVEIADRDLVEQGSDVILAGAQNEHVAFLVVGDPFGATTHADLILRAHELDIPITVIHNASIMNAVGQCGLSLYNYGQTVSFVFFTPSWEPESFYDRIQENVGMGLHTLCLLDIKVKEQSIENMARGRLVYEPPRYMTVNQAIEQLLLIEGRRKVGVVDEETLAVGVARLGTEGQCVKSGTLGELRLQEFGAPLHSLILVGKRLHFLEVEMLKLIAVDPVNLEAVARDKYKVNY